MNFLHLPMFTNQKILYLSPHYDDLVLSNGGLVRKIRPLCGNFTLVNVFTESLWSPNQEEAKTKEAVSALRFQEDQRYCQCLDLKDMRLGFDDSSVRGYSAITELMVEAREDQIFPRVKKRLKETLHRVSCDYIFCPLALGNHIDHVMIYETIRTINFPGTIFYEDLPYALKSSEEDIQKTILAKLGASISYNIDISDVIAAKIDDVLLYQSQIEEGLIEIVKAYAGRTKGGTYFERVWIKQ